MKFNFDNTYNSLPAELFSECKPTAVQNPQLVVLNHNLAAELGLNTDTETAESLAALFGGNQLPEKASNIAQAYSGHQFGHFTRLGDGRAVMLGEQLTPDGKRFDLQFKGSGITPYSRRGDGRATLSAMLREYIISEAMHALKIATSRSLAVVASGEAVYREQVQQGAILTRVAASHIRIGTFEHIARFCEPKTLKLFTEYTINRHYPELNGSKNPALELLKTVMKNQIDLIVNWMRVGFIHGVMNTDNMTISAETIDYGPCAFMNTYKPETVFSSIDTNGRYAFENQGQIVLWNLTRFAECLLSLIDENTEKAIKKAQEVLHSFKLNFEESYLNMMANKIGLQRNSASNEIVINNLLDWMYTNEADYTNTFVELMYPGTIKDKVFEIESFRLWKDEWRNLLEEHRISNETAQEIMIKTNPIYIPRNHTVEAALKSATETSNTQLIKELNQILSAPYALNNFDLRYMSPPLFNETLNYKTYCGT